MAISTVKLTLNGTEHLLTYDSSSATYKATISAPAVSSYSQTDHVFAGVVTVTDTAGNTATATKTDFASLGLRVIERTIPVISVTSPASGAMVTTSKPTFEWTVTDNDSGIDTSTIQLTCNGTTYTTSSTPAVAVTAISGGYSCTLTPSVSIPDGSVTATYNVSDNDGNAAAQVSVTFTIDTASPTLNVTSPLDGAITNNASLTVAGTTDADSVTVNGNTVTVTGGAFSTVITLSEGSNTVTVIATDLAARSTTITRTVTLDSTPPVISAITVAPNPVDAGQTYVISVTVTDT